MTELHPDKNLSPLRQDVLMQHPLCPTMLGHSQKRLLGTGVVNKIKFVYQANACLHILHGTRDAIFDLLLRNSMPSRLYPRGHPSLVQRDKIEMEVNHSDSKARRFGSTQKVHLRWMRKHCFKAKAAALLQKTKSFLFGN